ncbi:hypothetical protein X748_24150 [Mesorhizobium sp. LNJC386A00]|nr:hypothetical protein X748_24150 [Mesorhizobium sp. LNJC386A00]
MLRPTRTASDNHSSFKCSLKLSPKLSNTAFRPTLNCGFKISQQMRGGEFEQIGRRVRTLLVIVHFAQTIMGKEGRAASYVSYLRRWMTRSGPV